jgi:hypothetical protein
VIGRRPPGDTVSFSPESVQRAAQASFSKEETEGGLGVEGELTEEEQREVQQLKQRDTEVRRHEQAHLAAGGQYVRGGANFSYTTGPDGRRYASGGEVSIDVSGEGTPEATIRKMQIVRRAALAPAQPSPQDRQVAAQASQQEAAARQELAQTKVEEAGVGGTVLEDTQGTEGAAASGPVSTSTPQGLDLRV